MKPNALLLALLAILLWSFLAILGARVSHLPPFLVVGISLSISGVIGLIGVRQWLVPLKTFLVGLGGLFGYHFFYFSAFKYAPPIEVSLMNYLWPLLIVVLAPLFLAKYSLRPHHIVGALLGLAGAGLIVTNGELSLEFANLWGNLLAALAALIWACYSLLTKKLPHFSTAAVGGFCLASGLISLVAYSLGETQTGGFVSLKTNDWLNLVLLGAGPMGAAFFVWDAALKGGDPRIIGSLAYLTPLTSTLVLVGLGGQKLTWVTGIAMGSIVIGALIGALDVLRGILLRHI